MEDGITPSQFHAADGTQDRRVLVIPGAPDVAGNEVDLATTKGRE